MGLSIHYSGYILKKEMLDSLIEEVSDVAKTLAGLLIFLMMKISKEFLLLPKKASLFF